MATNCLSCLSNRRLLLSLMPAVSHPQQNLALSCFSNAKPISIFQFPCRKLSASCISSSAYSPLSGVEDELVGYVLGKKKATEVAHLVWKHVVRKGDTVIDATCGNGYDTLAMLKLVADDTARGRVYGLDIQRDALASTSALLDGAVTPKEKELVKLFYICHSRIEEVVPENSPVSLVAFNLGYRPGGDKAVTTVPETTVAALNAAARILVPGGLISLVIYVGHPGGREELGMVEAFASGLSVDKWICCKFEMLNRPLAPVLTFLFKRSDIKESSTL